ncbi:uncharacterized protein [Triticum aestivum]|uniref:uncharacterized protein n=1 Tax=Triticum aestivum TaxID=4565 RepID=UPI001D00486E|nr:uncharacterized protein LOC123157992 [Triticum aestivum]
MVRLGGRCSGVDRAQIRRRRGPLAAGGGGWLAEPCRPRFGSGRVGLASGGSPPAGLAGCGHWDRLQRGSRSLMGPIWARLGRVSGVLPRLRPVCYGLCQWRTIAILDGRRFCDWETYRSFFTSYEIDEEYVKLFEEISKKIKWLKRYMEYERASSKWKEMDDRGFCQAAKIAAGFPRMSYKLTLMAYEENVWNLMFDYWQREDIDRLFFEIWKFATKKMGATDKKIDFRAGLVDVCRRNIFPRYRKRMQFALDHSTLSDLESNFDTCVEDIPDDATEDVAWRLITSAVWNKLHKPKMWHQYIMRKMEIAKHIGLGPQN